MRAGAAISIVAPVSLPNSLMLAEPGPRSASAESAKIEKAEATVSCLDIFKLNLCCNAANYRNFYCNATSPDLAEISRKLQRGGSRAGRERL